MYQLVVTYKKNKYKSNFDEEFHNFFIKNGLKVYDKDMSFSIRRDNDHSNVVRYVAESHEDLKNQSFYFETFFKMNKLWKEQKWKRDNNLKDYSGDGWFCGVIDDDIERPLTEYISTRIEFIDTSRTVEFDNLI